MRLGNDHRKWILKPVSFEKKSSDKKSVKVSKTAGPKEKISLDKWLSLSPEARKQYKEVLDKTLLLDVKEYGIEEVNAFSKEKQKYCLKAEDVKEFNGVRIKDSHGHIFVKHDLYNHDKELDELWTSRDVRLKGRYTKDGIAEAFAEFAKKEGLSFF